MYNQPLTEVMPPKIIICMGLSYKYPHNSSLITLYADKHRNGGWCMKKNSKIDDCTSSLEMIEEYIHIICVCAQEANVHNNWSIQ